MNPSEGAFEQVLVALLSGTSDRDDALATHYPDVRRRCDADSPPDDVAVEAVQTFEQASVLHPQPRGLVVHLSGGSCFQLSLVRA